MKLTINNLPELTGSEKQIKWAESLRAKFIDQANAMLEKHPSPAASEKRFIDAVAKVLDDQTTAAWWIDSRDDDLSRVCPCHTRLEAIRAAGR
jgi:hypothetical protein